MEVNWLRQLIENKEVKNDRMLLVLGMRRGY